MHQEKKVDSSFSFFVPAFARVVMRNKFMQEDIVNTERNSVTIGKNCVHFAYHKNVCKRCEYRVWTTTEKAFYLVQLLYANSSQYMNANLFASFRATFYLISCLMLSPHTLYLRQYSIFHLTFAISIPCISKSRVLKQNPCS